MTTHKRTRRQILKATAAAVLAPLELARAATPGARSGSPAGRLVGIVPLRRSTSAPLETRLGSGLDGRLFTNLSTLTDDGLVVSNDRFFVRTTAPPEVRRLPPETIVIGGRVRQPVDVGLGSLAAAVQPMGTHLLECSGNTEAANFGLMSAARWDGVPLAPLLDRVTALGGTTRVLVSGIDDLTTPSSTSTPGASWVFARDDLDRAGAFLATRMNDVPLPLDHGFPVRLVVPGWYGCACIKWVNRIELVGDETEATSQMREFARRTHQEGVPRLAREFAPAVIDAAAMPVRVEKWLVDGRLVYRVVGVLWGGSKPTNALQIRFKSSEPFVPVTDCPLPASTTTWSLWRHDWHPPAPGRYQIVLRINDPGVRTRRLDLFFYTREVDVAET